MILMSGGGKANVGKIAVSACASMIYYTQMASVATADGGRGFHILCKYLTHSDTFRLRRQSVVGSAGGKVKQKS